MDSDLTIRNAAIEHCSALDLGDAVPDAELTKGFAFEGQQVKLVMGAREFVAISSAGAHALARDSA